MTGPTGDPVAAALRALAADDPEAARLAEAAFDSVTFGEGLAGITQHGLQEWLWYQLPVKWLTDPGGVPGPGPCAEPAARAP